MGRSRRLFTLVNSAIAQGVGVLDNDILREVFRG